MNIKIKVKFTDGQKNELQPELRIDSLSPALQKFIDMLLEDIIIEHIEKPQSANEAVKSTRKPIQQTKGSVIDPTQKKKPLKIKGFCKASPSYRTKYCLASRFAYVLCPHLALSKLKRKQARREYVIYENFIRLQGYRFFSGSIH